MILEWKPVQSASTAISHPLVLRARLAHGWLVASQVQGGFSMTFVPFAPPDDGSEGARPWRADAEP